MNDTNRDLLIKVASTIENFDDWFKLEDFELLLQHAGFQISSTGEKRLLDYLLTIKDLFRVRVDLENKKRQTYLVTFIGEPVFEESEMSEMLQYGISEETKHNSREILNSIADNWKLEAKLEANSDYFYHLREIRSILNKSKYYVIGRKGSGKSSISEYLHGLKDYKTFTEKLSFKNYPFNALYSLDNSRYTPPNQYITIWKYLIYSTVARLMVSNEKIDLNVRSKLKEIYAPEPIRSLERTISKWTSAEFGATILGTGGTFNISRELSPQSSSWIDRVNNLEDII
jgi:hypothetical protein